MRGIKLFTHQFILSLFFLGFFFALTACDSGQVCGADNQSDCILNKNSSNVPEEDLYPPNHDNDDPASPVKPDEPFVPPSDDDHEKTIPDEYVDTLKQVEFQFDVENIPATSTAASISFTYSYSNDLLSNANGTYTLNLSAPFTIKDLFKPIETLNSEIFVRTNYYLDDSNPSARNLYVRGTVAMPTDTSFVMDEKLVMSFYNGGLGQQKQDITLTASFPYQNPAAYQYLQGHFKSVSGGSYSNLLWLAQTYTKPSNKISANYRVIAQGEQSRFKIYDVNPGSSGSDAGFFMSLYRDDSKAYWSVNVDFGGTNIEGTIGGKLRALLSYSSCNGNVSYEQKNNEYIFTITGMPAGCAALQIYAAPAQSDAPATTTFKVALLNDDGDVFEPIIFDGTKPTPITTMNLLPRVLAPKN